LQPIWKKLIPLTSKIRQEPLMRSTAIVTTIIMLLMPLLACGQKGALYLPQDKPGATAAADQEVQEVTAEQNKTKKQP
jgi:predicted small lipoprotein YifL